MVIRQQKYWAEKTFENEVKKEIFQKNYIRLKLMKTVAEKYGGGTAKAAVDLYNKTEGAWAYQDSEFARLHPDYQPKIPAGYGDAAPLQNENNVDEKQANEPANDNPLRTSIVIEELGENDNRKDVSQRIEEQPTQSKEMAIE